MTMGICVLCGKSAGWFRSEHAGCRAADDAAKAQAVAENARNAEAKAQVRATLEADVSATIKAGGDLLELESRLLGRVIDASVGHGDVRNALIAGWTQAAEQMLDDGVLSAEEESNLQNARERFSLDVASLDAHGMFSRAAKAGILRAVMSGEPTPSVEVESGFPINLQRGEKAVWCFSDVDYLEDKVRRQFVGGSQGVSVRIMSGVYYRVGAFKGESVYSTERQHVGKGFLLVTDQGLYFHGSQKSMRIPFRKIVSFTPYKDGIGLMRDAQTAKPQIFQTQDGWFAYNLITNLARR